MIGKARAVAAIAGAVAGILWPFLVLGAAVLGWDARLFWGVALVLGARCLLARPGDATRWVAAAGFVFSLLAALRGSLEGTLWYPVAVNAVLLAVFGVSLARGMPVAERLARLSMRGRPLPGCRCHKAIAPRPSCLASGDASSNEPFSKREEPDGDVAQATVPERP